MSEYEPITTELREWAHAMLVDGVAKRVDQYCDAIDAVHRNLEDMVGGGWMKLPVDADGVPIHIGDMMVYADGTHPKEVIAVTGTTVYLCDDGPRYADMCRHYSPPTVESILAEYTEHLCELCTTEYACDSTREELMRQYADKLEALCGKA